MVHVDLLQRSPGSWYHSTRQIDAPSVYFSLQQAPAGLESTSYGWLRVPLSRAPAARVMIGLISPPHIAAMWVLNQPLLRFLTINCEASQLMAVTYVTTLEAWLGLKWQHPPCLVKPTFPRMQH